MKSTRTWVYAVLIYKNKAVVIKKWRWPFTWMYDLPWWKIEHWEWIIESLKRELEEEVWLKEVDFEIEKILTAEEIRVKHTYNWEYKDQHIIGIVYQVKITKDDFDLSYVENWWDANGLKLINFDDVENQKTHILEMSFKKYLKF